MVKIDSLSPRSVFKVENVSRYQSLTQCLRRSLLLTTICHEFVHLLKGTCVLLVFCGCNKLSEQ